MRRPHDAVQGPRGHSLGVGPHPVRPCLAAARHFARCARPRSPSWGLGLCSVGLPGGGSASACASPSPPLGFAWPPGGGHRGHVGPWLGLSARASPVAAVALPPRAARLRAGPSGSSVGAVPASPASRGGGVGSAPRLPAPRRPGPPLRAPSGGFAAAAPPAGGLGAGSARPFRPRPPAWGLTGRNIRATMMLQGRPALYRQPSGWPQDQGRGRALFCLPLPSPSVGGGGARARDAVGVPAPPRAGTWVKSGGHGHTTHGPRFPDLPRFLNKTAIYFVEFVSEVVLPPF